MPARILYTAFDVVPSPKGASPHIVHFLRGLVNGGYCVHLMTPGDGTLPAEDCLEGAQVSRVSPQPGNNFLAQAVAYGQAVMAHVAGCSDYAGGYAVAHYRSLWSGLPLAQNQKRYGYRTLFEVNGLMSVELKYHYSGLQGTPLLAKIKEQEIATLLLSDVIVCPSEVTRAYLVSLGALREQVVVIPNGVSPRDFAAAPLLPDDGHLPTLLYIGTLADWQGLNDLVQAMPLILQARPARLRIVGRGRSRQRKALAKLVRKLGLEEHVSLEPPTPHHAIPGLIAEADVCVAPLGLNDRNITQGCCPIKVLEYMAVGRPLVASNLPVVRELAREDVDGLFSTPGDPADLARQVLALLADRRLAQKLAHNAAQRTRQHFTWHEAQKRLLKVYEQLLNQP